MGKDIYIKKSLIDNVSISELDFDLQDEFGFNYDDDDSQFREIMSDAGRADTYPVKIDVLMRILQDMKDQGATHVELDYHCDHIGYDISAFHISHATAEEIAEVNQRERLHREKMQKRAELLRQLDELEREGKPAEDEDLPF